MRIRADLDPDPDPKHWFKTDKSLINFFFGAGQKKDRLRNLKGHLFHRVWTQERIKVETVRRLAPRGKR